MVDRRQILQMLAATAAVAARLGRGAGLLAQQGMAQGAVAAGLLGSKASAATPRGASVTRARALLEQVRKSFPSPFVHAEADRGFRREVEAALVKIAALKTGRPALGERVTIDYAKGKRERIPESPASAAELTSHLSRYLNGMVQWSHPDTHRLHGAATSASIIGQLCAAVYDPNLVWDDLSGGAALAEVEAVAMCADLVGFDPEAAGGAFTFGGSGTTLYGVKVGIEKAQPGALREGVHRRIRVVASAAAHYAKATSAAWLGLGSDAVVPIPTDESGAMDLVALEKSLREMVKQGDRIGAIIATLGTTDAFTLDDLAGIVQLRDKLHAELGLDYVPHVHADAVIGWAYSVFHDYDFDGDPLSLGAGPSEDLLAIRARTQGLRLADSIGIDFHKSGYTPYMSSLVLFRRREDLEKIARDRGKIPYLFQFGNYDPGIFTLECSRSAGPVFAALANLRLFGKNGFRALLANSIAMARLLRERVKEEPSLVIANPGSHGCAVVLRPYPEGVDAAASFSAERGDPGRAEELSRGNDYVRRVYMATRELAERGEGAIFVLTSDAGRTAYGAPIAGIKCFSYSAFSDEASVGRALLCLQRARRMVAQADAPPAP